MWWDHQDVKQKATYYPQSESEFSFVSVHSNESETKVSVSEYPSTALVRAYTEMTSPYMESALVAAINCELEDTAPPLSVSPVLGSVTEEEEMSVAERVIRRRRHVPQQEDDRHNLASPDLVTKAVNVSPSVSSPSSCGDEESNNNNTTTGAFCKYVSNVLSCMKYVAPAGKFDAAKSRKKKKKMRKRTEKKSLHPDLLSIWKNADSLFPASSVPCVPDPSPYPMVDWSRVNKRLIGHIPDPEPQPVHGVHQDPAFYESKEVLKPHVPGTYPKRHTMSVPPRFKEKNPFGTLPGYLTDAGVIHPHSNTQMVHGYVWSPSMYKYILHAEFQRPEKENVKKVKERDKPNSKRDVRRKRRVALDDL